MQPLSEHRRHARIAARLGRVLAWVLGALLLLAVLGVIALRSRVGRAQLASRASTLLSELLVGEFEIGSVPAFSGAWIVLRDVVVRDNDGRVVVKASRVEATLDLAALLSGDLVFTQIAVGAPWVSLHQRGTSLAIAEVFLPAGPPSAEPSSRSEPFLFAVHHARIVGGSVVALDGALGARRVDANGAMSYSDAYRLQLSAVRGQVRHASGAELALNVSEGLLSVADNEHSRLSGALRFGHDRLGLKLAAVWGEHGFESADAHVRGVVSPSELSASGLGQVGALLAAPIALRAEAHYTREQQRLMLRSELDTAGGALLATAEHVADHGELHVEARELELARALTLPGLRRASFDLTLSTDKHGASRALLLRSGPIGYGSQELPPWTAQGELDPHGAHLRTLDVPSFRAQHGELTVDLTAERNGDVHGSLAARLPRMTRDSRLGQLSGARADALRLAANGRYRAADHTLEGEASAQLSSLSLGENSVRALRARARVSGSASKPKFAGEVSLSGLRLATLRVDKAELSATGGPLNYRLTASASAGKAQARADFTLSASASEQRISGSGELTRFLPQPISFSVEDLRIRPEAIVVRALRANAGTSLLAIEGRYGLTQSSDLHVRLEQLALSLPLHAMESTSAQAGGGTKLDALRGHAQAHLHFQGSLAEPSFELSLHVPDLARGDTPLGSLALNASLDRRGLGAAQLSLNADGAGSLLVALQATLPRTGALPQRVKLARYELSLRGAGDVSRIARLISPEAAAADAGGTFSLEGRLDGSLQAPHGRLTLAGSGLKLGATGPLATKLEATFQETRSQLSLALADRAGPLSSLDADLHQGLSALVSTLAAGRAAFVPGSYQLKLAERELSQLPPPLTRDEPLALSLSAQLLTFADRSPRAQIMVEARGTSHDSACAQAALPHMKLVATLAEGRLRASAQGELAGKRVLNAMLNGPLPWFFGAAPTAPTNEGYALAVDVAQVDLAQLPITCQAFRGQLTSSLRAERLLASHPHLTGQLMLRGLKVREAEALDLSLSALGDDSGLHVSSADIESKKRRTLHAEAHLPWRWDGADQVTLDRANCRAQAQLSELGLDALLALVPNVAQPAGHVSGELSLHGCEDLSGLRGRLNADHVSMTLKDPLLRFDDVSAKLAVSQDAIALEGLHVSDQGGDLDGRGKIQLMRGAPTRVELSMTADGFPLRSDARVAAHVDGKFAVTAQWDEVPRKVMLALNDVSFRLPTQRAQKAQEIARHADIVYIDAQTSALTAHPASDQPSVPIELAIESGQPFWVRRDDFGVQLETHLKLSAGVDGARISGPVLVRRGFINLLSKGFDIERGQLLFDGEERPDPTVTIDAVHKLGDGQTVTVRVRERLSQPVVTFATSVAGVATDAEIMQLLMRGREASATETAQAQVGAALASMTSQLVGSLGRTKLGKYVPVLALEAGASSGTRIRAGVEANALIPAKLRTVVEGAYVEGFVGGKNQGGNAQATGGVLMELYFPKRLVTGGTWELPNNWTVELTWEP